MIPGDPGAVEAAAGALGTAGGEFVEARDSVAAHGRATTAEWTGPASMMALAKSASVIFGSPA